ncbi:roadblock/LC7 domain-containing protein [Fodinicola acaciae]|uniref:roadblock/LC7 domain-containing protein n=1 Tax=Fodinicola acaciae TaxID=2681555 RepID=UPI0013D8B5FC|nr:roadblock/LC7 domain-containing protein [Fodinicola acaciae]
MTRAAPSGQRPRNPREFAWLLTNFASSTAGVSHALLVSSDGLPLIAAGRMSRDVADPLAAMTSGMLSLGNNIAALIGQHSCDQIMLRFPSGHFLFMNISTLAGLAVLTEEGANLSVVAFQMAQLVDSVGHVLTPQLRDDLRRMSTSQATNG